MYLPPGSYAPKLTLYLGLRFMPNSSCHEAEEPELHQILTPGEGSDSAKTVGLSRSRRSFVARKAKDSECSLQWSRLLLWHSVRGRGNSTWGRCHQKEEVCALESSLNLGSWLEVPSCGQGRFQSHSQFWLGSSPNHEVSLQAPKVQIHRSAPGLP